MTLKVHEIFYSIQGESSFAGYPCVFVRLAGCNLRCTYCDTPYAYEDGNPMELSDIVGRLASYDCGLVEITGGEPLMQRETPALVERLLSEKYTVLLETNGSKDISVIDDRCVRIVDVKCPTSGQKDKNDLGNLRRLSMGDEVKFVIGNRIDYEYAKDLIEGFHEQAPCPVPVHFSPVFQQLAPEKLATWILHDRLPVRLHLQLHKIVWGKDARGV